MLEDLLSIALHKIRSFASSYEISPSSNCLRTFKPYLLMFTAPTFAIATACVVLHEFSFTLLAKIYFPPVHITLNNIRRSKNC